MVQLRPARANIPLLGTTSRCLFRFPRKTGSMAHTVHAQTQKHGPSPSQRGGLHVGLLLYRGCRNVIVFSLLLYYAVFPAHKISKYKILL